MLTNEEWERITENSLDGIFLSDGKGNVIYANQAYLKISGLSPEEIYGRSVQDLFEEKLMSKAGTVLVMQTKQPMTIDSFFYRTNKHALVSCNPILDENGEISIIVSNVRDMTDIYRLQEKIDKDQVMMRRYKEELDVLKKQTELQDNIIVHDQKSLETLFLASRIASSDSTVLITGESGVGKEEYARYVHRASRRKDNAFIRLNCSAIAESLLESELFGYERGAFTGANKEGKPGLFEIADKGTLFLDEIGELPAALQPKLLRVLQEGEFTRVGGVRPVRVDVRVVAATNRDLEAMVREKTFRQDLYYRLNVIPLNIPPLRERKEDIRPLAEHFLKMLNKKYGFRKFFSEMTIKAMMAYPWPGNIRELRNLIERAVILASGDELFIPEISPLDTNRQRAPEIGEDFDLADFLRRTEYDYMKRAYRKAGNIRDASDLLQMKRSTFAGKFKEYKSQYEEAERE